MFRIYFNNNMVKIKKLTRNPIDKSRNDDKIKRKRLSKVSFSHLKREILLFFFLSFLLNTKDYVYIYIYITGVDR